MDAVKNNKKILKFSLGAVVLAAAVLAGLFASNSSLFKGFFDASSDRFQVEFTAPERLTNASSFNTTYDAANNTTTHVMKVAPNNINTGVDINITGQKTLFKFKPRIKALQSYSVTLYEYQSDGTGNENPSMYRFIGNVTPRLVFNEDGTAIAKRGKELTFSWDHPEALTSLVGCVPGPYCLNDGRLKFEFMSLDGSKVIYYTRFNFVDLNASSFTPTVTFTGPSTINQSNYNATNNIGAAADIPNNLNDGAEFYLSTNYASVSTNIVFTQGGQKRVVYKYGTLPAGAVETIKWDANKCGVYNGLNKTANAQCPTGTYTYEVVSVNSDGGANVTANGSFTVTRNGSGDGTSDEPFVVNFTAPTELSNSSNFTNSGSTYTYRNRLDINPNDSVGTTFTFRSTNEDISGYGYYLNKKNSAGVYERIRSSLASGLITYSGGTSDVTFNWQNEDSLCGTDTKCLSGDYLLELSLASNNVSQSATYNIPLKFIAPDVVLTRTITVDAPNQINQSNFNATNTIGATADIPKTLNDGREFSFSSNFPSSSTVVRFVSNGQNLAVYDYGNLRAGASRTIVWDANKCGTYNNALDKTANLQCPTGAYQMVVNSTPTAPGAPAVTKTVNFTVNKDTGGGGGTDPVITSCTLDTNLSSNDVFNPNGSNMRFTVKAAANNVAQGRATVKISGPYARSPFNINENVTIKNKSLYDEQLNFPIDKTISWDGKVDIDGDGSDDKLTKGVYVATYNVSATGADDCTKTYKFAINYRNNSGVEILSITPEDDEFELGEDEFYAELETGIDSVRTVVNLYEVDEDDPIATVFYKCAQGQGCPESKGKLDAGSYDLLVSNLVREPGEYFLWASIKDSSGEIYSAKSDSFEAYGTGFIPECNFRDVDSRDRDYDAIMNICDLGIMVGSNGRFNPDAPINRIEGITIANRLAYCPIYRWSAAIDGDFGFVDMTQRLRDPNSRWIFDEALRGINCLRVTGYGDRTLRPAQVLAHAEGWKLVLEGAQSGGIAEYRLPYINESKNPWWTDYEFLLIQEGIRLPYGGTQMSRREMATFIDALIESGVIDPL